MFRTVLTLGTAAAVLAVASISGVQAEQKDMRTGQPNTAVKSGAPADQKGTRAGQPNTAVNSRAQADQKGTRDQRGRHSLDNDDFILHGQPNTAVKSRGQADQKGTRAGQPNTAVKSGAPADQKGTRVLNPHGYGTQIVRPDGTEIVNDHKMDGRVCVLGKEGGYNPDTGEFTTWPVLKCNDQ